CTVWRPHRECRHVRLVAVPVSSASWIGHLNWKIDRAHGRGGERANTFGSLVLRDHLDLCNPYRAACLHGFRTGYDFLAVRRAEKVALDSAVHGGAARGGGVRPRRARGLVGKARKPPAVEMAEELRELGSLRQCERDLARLGSDDTHAG